MYSVIWVLLKVALKLGGVALFFFLVFTKFKPVIALWLALKDFIRMDKHTFRGYGFWLFCGLGGSGKTISIVEYLLMLRKQYPKLKIYTNFDFDFADGKIDSWQDIVQTTNDELIEISEDEFHSLRDRHCVERDGHYYKIQHNGIVFAFDEIHLTFTNTRWADCPDNMLEYISQQRKLHKQILASSQVFTRVDVKLREQTNNVVECRSFFMGRLIYCKYFNTAEYLAGGDKKDSGHKKRKAVRRHLFVAYDDIRKAYDTEQVMVDLLERDSADTDSTIAELVRRLQKK